MCGIDRPLCDYVMYFVMYHTRGSYFIFYFSFTFLLLFLLLSISGIFCFLTHLDNHIQLPFLSFIPSVHLSSLDHMCHVLPNFPLFAILMCHLFFHASPLKKKFFFFTSNLILIIKKQQPKNLLFSLTEVCLFGIF